SSTIIAIHSLTNRRTDNKEEAEKKALIDEMFRLCTNTFIGKCDGETLNVLPELIRGITVQDTQVISKFKKGKHGERQFLGVDDIGRKIIFSPIVNDFQKEYFGGGA
ncbi:MAG: hypothetical protein ACK5LC_01345, partial [Coprobacillaceae bacterium]